LQAPVRRNLLGLRPRLRARALQATVWAAFDLRTRLSSQLRWSLPAVRREVHVHLRARLTLRREMWRGALRDHLHCECTDTPRSPIFGQCP
jgi:hypothetical protein